MSRDVSPPPQTLALGGTRAGLGRGYHGVGIITKVLGRGYDSVTPSADSACERDSGGRAVLGRGHDRVAPSPDSACERDSGGARDSGERWEGSSQRLAPGRPQSAPGDDTEAEDDWNKVLSDLEEVETLRRDFEEQRLDDGELDDSVPAYIIRFRNVAS